MMGLPAEATATIHVATEGSLGSPPPPGLAEAISAMVQQAANSALGQAAQQQAAQQGASVGSRPGSPSPSSIRHPPPSTMAEVLELHQAAQARLATLAPRLTNMLRNDPSLSGTELTSEQTYFNNYSQCLHFLAHAQHALSDIMINLSRPPPRQLRARPFVIQSVVQSAVLQSVPIVTTSTAPSTPSAPASSAPTPTAAAPPTSASATAPPATATPAADTNTTNSSSAAAALAAHAAAVSEAAAVHASAHAAAVSEASVQAGSAGAAESLSQLLGAAAGAGGSAQMQPVVVGIELGPEMFSQTGPAMGMANTSGNNMQGMISSAIQQALRNGPPTSQASGNNVPNGPQVQVAVGPPLHLPMGPH